MKKQLQSLRILKCFSTELSADSNRIWMGLCRSLPIDYLTHRPIVCKHCYCCESSAIHVQDGDGGLNSNVVCSRVG